MGQAQAMQNHSGDSFAWRHHFLLIWHETSVNHGHQPSVLHHRSDQASMIETLDANLFHLATLPCSSLMQSRRRRRVNDFFSLSTCSMSDVGEFVCCEDIVNSLLLEFCNDAKFLGRVSI